MMQNITCKTSPVSRAKGHSAVAGAAYRAGENLKGRGLGNEGQDKWFRYGNRSSIVREAFIMAPDGAPDWVQDRGDLWNRVEEQETRKNARLGREVQLGLAYGLSHDEQRDLLREFVGREFTAKGFVADVAVHNYGRAMPAAGGSEEQLAKVRGWAAADLPFLEPEEAQGMADAHVVIDRNKGGDAMGYRLYQPHAHVRVTPRVIEAGEFVQNKTASRELNKAETATAWRYEWPKLQNASLERAGLELRVSSTSAEEDAFAGVPLRSTAQPAQLQAVEDRKHELTPDALASHEEAMATVQIDREFRTMHNDTLKQTATDNAPTAPAHDTARDTLRTTTWWRNMHERFQGWREDFTEAATEWKDRFAGQEGRLRQLFGWHRQLDDTGPEAEAQEVHTAPDDAVHDTGHDALRTAPEPAPEPEPPQPDEPSR